MKYGLVDTNSGGTGIAGGISPSQPGQGPMVTFYVQVDDLAATLKKAEQMGGKTIMPPTDIPGMVSMAMFADPDGNVIGLVLPEPPPA
jgi:predicted enzyme related to lactoylglutathione lyase